MLVGLGQPLTRGFQRFLYVSLIEQIGHLLATDAGVFVSTRAREVEPFMGGDVVDGNVCPVRVDQTDPKQFVSIRFSGQPGLGRLQPNICVRHSGIP